MSFLKLFAGKTPEAHEQKGDTFCEARHWGKAKIAFERALEKLERASAPDAQSINRIQEKIGQTKESLARRHHQTAVDLLDGGALDDARELIALALELSTDPVFREELERMHTETEGQLAREVAGEFGFSLNEGGSLEIPELENADDEYFNALCGTLPEELQQAYPGYGENFKIGYLALNHGDFEGAVEGLTLAMSENPSPDSYIPLELATAHWNLGNASEARQLLEPFIENHPDALPAYQLLCEIFWDQGTFEKAEALLSRLPTDLAASVAVHLLKGETLFRAGNITAAQTYYTEFMQTYGYNEAVARALAQTHEALGEPAQARDVYANIMSSCAGCGARIDPVVKHKYADLSFEAGLHTMDILELYLGLARERPEYAADFYEKVSRIYAAMGYDDEARRFHSFAIQAGGEEGHVQ